MTPSEDDTRRPRPGVVRRVSRKSKRVSVNNVHLPPERDERALSRFERWILGHPYLGPAVVTGLLCPAGFVVRFWLVGDSATASLIGTAINCLLTMLLLSVVFRFQRRLYRHSYRSND